MVVEVTSFSDTPSTAPLACAGKYAEIIPAAAVVPVDFRNVRRDGLT
jgi:hypothetical protein